MAYIGIDLHSDNFSTCRLEPGVGSCFATYGLDSSDLERFVSSLSPEDEIAVESTGNASWFCDRVGDFGGRIVVVNTRKFDVTRRVGRKTDRADSEALAYYLSKDMLPSVRLKSRVHDDIATLVHGRALLVKHRTSLVNSVHGIYVRLGVRHGKSKLTTRKHLMGLDLSILSPGQRHLVEVFRSKILELTSDIKGMESLAISEAGSLRGFEGVCSITGIGPFTAAALLAEIGSIGDFENSGKLAAYFGLVPRIYQSNETVYHGRITKSGNSLVRTLLVQCTWIAIRYSSFLRDHFDRVHSNSGSRKKAVVATARKLLCIVYRVLRDDLIYDDFPNNLFHRNEQRGENG